MTELQMEVAKLIQSRPKKHYKQINAFQDKIRHKFLLCGRRGGKTYLIKESIANDVEKMPPGSDVFYMGPTNSEAMELMWEPLEETFFELDYSFKPLVSKHYFSFSGRRRVFVIGSEKYDRIRGKANYHIYFDEFGFFQKPLAKIMRAAYPTLTDFKGGMTVATTPPGKGTESYEFYLEAIKRKDWKYYHWTTFDNPHMDAEEIQDAMTQMDEKSFRQEYLSTWESFEGLAYFNFDENIHIKNQPELNYSLPVILHFDFNVNPTTLVIGQKYPEMYSFKKEYSIKNSNETVDTVKMFCEDFKEDRSKINLLIRGDSTGRGRSPFTGKTGYHYIEEALKDAGFNFRYEVPAKNPEQVDRVRQVNGYLKNVRGQHRMEVDPGCTELIKDLSSQQMEGRNLSTKNNLGHKGDAIGYGIWWEYLNSSGSKSSTILL